MRKIIVKRPFVESTYITSVFLHLMCELMRIADSAAPKAVLTQLILATLLTLVSESVKVRALTHTARDRMLHILHDGEPVKYVQPDEAGGPNVRQSHIQKVVQSYRGPQVETGL